MAESTTSLWLTRYCSFTQAFVKSGERVRERRYINHHVLYLDEGAKETWETFIIISGGRHRVDRQGAYGEGMQCQTPRMLNAECRMQDASRCLRQTCMVMWVRKVRLVHGDRGYLGFWAWLLLGGA
jgi:hypothetical protein